MPAMSGTDLVTADDVAVMNGQTVARAAAFARLAGTGLIVVSGVTAIVWLWLTVRYELLVDDGSSSGVGPSGDTSLAERLDLAAGLSQYLVYAAVVLGVGVGLRLLADYSVARTGGSLTGFEPGDLLPPELPSGPGDLPQPDLPPPLA